MRRCPTRHATAVRPSPPRGASRRILAPNRYRFGGGSAADPGTETCADRSISCLECLAAAAPAAGPLGASWRRIGTDSAPYELARRWRGGWGWWSRGAGGGGVREHGAWWRGHGGGAATSSAVAGARPARARPAHRPRRRRRHHGPPAATPTSATTPGTTAAPTAGRRSRRRPPARAGRRRSSPAGGDRALVEVSGLAAGRRNPDVLWTHNDSGNGPVFAIDQAGDRRSPR